MKKILSVILSITLLLGGFSLSGIVACAKTSGDFEYSVLDDGTAQIKKYRGSATDLTIPSQIDGYTVTYIGFEAFFKCSSLKSVKIPNSITNIGASAFQNCESLKSVKLPNSITVIEDEVFQDCTSLKSITIPNSVTTIEYEAFCNTSLKSITIPNSVTTIRYEAFSSCKYLKSVKLPDSVITIEGEAFSWCPKLKSIMIPKSVKSIGEYALGYDKGQKIKNFTIYGYSGSIAKTYAKKNKMIFISVDEVNSVKSAMPNFNLTAGKKRFKVKYIAVANAVGFQVRYKIKGKWTVKTVNTTTSVTKTIKKLKSGKNYKVQIRVFSYGKKVYSKWSKVKTVKVK